MVELDHIFVMTEEGAPEADRLVEFGLTEGSPRRHAGQGTANRRFFFRNAMLEFLWVHSPQEAQSEATRRTQLWERWSGRAGPASPFGVALRPAPSSRPRIDLETGRQEPAPFPAWEYCPQYLPPALVIHNAIESPLAEPMWFYLGFLGRPDATPAEAEPMQHSMGFQEVTGVTLSCADPSGLSGAARAVVDRGVVSIRSAPEPRLDLVFDGGSAGRSQAFVPGLPLVLHW